MTRQFVPSISRRFCTWRGRLARHVSALALGALLLGNGGTSAGAVEVRDLIAASKEAMKAAQVAQATVEQLDDKRADLLVEYKPLVVQLRNLREYNAQLERLIADQEQEKVRIRQEIADVQSIRREITPLMLSMLEGLEQFVALDVPFLKNEREERVERLKEMMDNSAVSSAEKFRRILEAWQIENEYGRTIEAYETRLADGRTVNMLRLGRVALIYKSKDLDDPEMGIWDQELNSWATLDSSYASAVSKGMAIARQQAAPDLLVLPVPAATIVQ